MTGTFVGLVAAVAAAVVAKGWSSYLGTVFGFGGGIADVGGYQVDWGALLIIAFVTAILAWGTKLSAGVSLAITAVKVSVVLLVVVVLASITVDLARLRLVQRQADDAAAAAANDAVTVGLDLEGLRRGADYRLDPVRVDEVVRRTLAVHDHAGIAEIRGGATLTGPRAVAVTVTARSPLAFARALPGAPRLVVLRARASATAELR